VRTFVHIKVILCVSLFLFEVHALVYLGLRNFLSNQSIDFLRVSLFMVVKIVGSFIKLYKS
jgi:hypothetical protein